MRFFLALVLAYVFSKVVFALAGFQYRLIGDPFNAGKLAIDFGVFIVLCFGFNWLLGRLGPFRPKGGA